MNDRQDKKNVRKRMKTNRDNEKQRKKTETVRERRRRHNRAMNERRGWQNRYNARKVRQADKCSENERQIEKV